MSEKSNPAKVEIEDMSPHVYSIATGIVKFLSDSHAYKTEGIFRVSGDHSKTHAMHEKLQQIAKPKMNEELEAMNVYDVADLLKLVLRSLSDPLITSACLRHIRRGLELHENLNGTIPHRECLGWYINSVLHSLTPNRYKLTKRIFSFLRKVISNEETTKMGRNPLSTIFGPILLAPKDTEGGALFFSENQKRVKALDFVLQLYQEHPRIFRRKIDSPRNLFSTDTFQVHQKLFVKGERISVFYWGDEVVLALVKLQIFELPVDLLHSSFSETKTFTKADSAIMRGSLEDVKAKKRVQSSPRARGRNFVLPTNINRSLNMQAEVERTSLRPKSKF